MSSQNLSYANIDTRYAKIVNVKAYGATGDGVTNDTVALQAAVNAATSSTPVGTVYLPAGKYMVNTAITSPSGIRLAMRGESKVTTEIAALNSLSGYIISPGTGFDISNLTISGNNLDGTYGLGGTGSYGGTILESVSFNGLEYAIRFNGAAQFPLKSVWRDIYVYSVRSCGIYINSTTDNGQSAWTFDNVVVTNGSSSPSRSLPAAGFTQTNDATSTTDTMSWSGSDTTEFGYVIMQLPSGSSDTNAWQWVADVASGTTSYTATKTAGTYFTYRAVRKSYGVYLRYGKSIDFGAIQCEEVAVGLYLKDCKAVQISSFYNEWRGITLTTPTPKGNGIEIQDCTGVVISNAWTDGVLSTLHSYYSSGVVADTIIAASVQRSVAHVSSSNQGQTLELGPTTIIGTTPARVTTSGSAFSNNITGWNTLSTDASVANRFSTNHTALAEFEAQYRGTRQAAIGTDGSGGYLAINAAASLPTAGASYAGQVRINNNTPYLCALDGTGGYSWIELSRRARVSNSTTALIQGQRSDNSQVSALNYTGFQLAFSRAYFEMGTGGVSWQSGAGTPEGSKTAPVGSLYTRTDGGTSTTLYVKESGTGNTGWIAK